MYLKRPTPKKEVPPKPKQENTNEYIIILVDPDQPDGSIGKGSIEITKPTVSQISLEPLPASVINEKAMVFRMDSRTLWTKYALGLVNYAVSDVANLATTQAVKERMAKSSTLIGDFFVPYYGIRAGDDISKLLTEIFNIGIDVVATLKKKGDIVPLETKWVDQTKQLAELFNRLNPSQYPVSLLHEMFDTLTKLWLDNIRARISENVILNAESIDGINKLVVTGIANHVNKGYTSLADLLSRGVIAQYPSAFME